MTEHTDPKAGANADRVQSSRHSDPDAHAELAQLADELRDAVLRVVWRQWRTLGAAAVGRHASRSRATDEETRHVEALIDPEALVLISLTLLRDEQRMGDMLHDWAVLNSDLLSVQRIKNLKADYPAPMQDELTHQLALFATAASDEGKDLRWRPLAHRSSVSGEGRRGVHASSDESVHEALARTAHAHAPSGARVKMRAARTRLLADATLLLRLRLGLGVGIKADLVAFLLARAEDWATVREAVDATGYTAAAVRRAAEDLAAARLIESLDGQPLSYRIIYGYWAPLLGIKDRPPRWAAWHERFVFAAAFLHWSEAARARPMSEYAFGAHGRDLLEHHRRAFEQDLVALWSVHSPVQDWSAFVSKSVRSLSAWMGEMA